MYQNNNAVETVKTDLAKLIMESNSSTSKQRVKASAERKLATRRAIEDHFEQRQLEKELDDYWLEE